MPSITLLGDSVFDNGAYTGEEPDVVGHLRAILPAGWQATLCAVDGATTEDFAPQLNQVPAETSHVVLSLGGNDALRNLSLIATPVRSTAESLDLFGERIAAFEARYRIAVDLVRALNRTAIVCTIYNGNLDGPDGVRARVALTGFNDAILRVAFERRLPVLDLRLVCNTPEDYANPIEPSGVGGQKIAAAVLQSVESITGDANHARVFGLAGT